MHHHYAKNAPGVYRFPFMVFDSPAITNLRTPACRNLCELENADEVKIDSIFEWGWLMLDFNSVYGVRILGGCCGTGIEHLQYLMANRNA